MKNNDLCAYFLASVSSSIYIANLIQAVDLAFKIMGLISGTIALYCFTKSAIIKLIAKIKEAKKDGVITKDEAKDIAKEFLDDAKEIAEMTHNLIENAEDINKKGGD